MIRDVLSEGDEYGREDGSCLRVNKIRGRHVYFTAWLPERMWGKELSLPVTAFRSALALEGLTYLDMDDSCADKKCA